MLQRGEQRVEFFQMGAVLGFELVDLGDAGCKGKLNGQRRNQHTGLAQLLDVQGWLRHYTRLGLEVRLCFRLLQIFRNEDAIRLP
jgi:hypothetical protein